MILSFVTVALSPITHAHFAVKDQNTGKEALFHLVPDDDPVAGQKSVLSFDFSKSPGGIQSDVNDFYLSVKNEANETSSVPLEITSNVIIAEYTFPVQGLYKVILDVRPKDGATNASKLEYAQRVARGVEAKKSSKAAFPSSLIIILVLFLAALLIVFNKKESIVNWSKSKSWRNRK